MITSAHVKSLLPGLLLTSGVAGAALVLEQVERLVFGRAWLEGLVLAILLGSIVRTAWTPPARAEAGVGFAAKTVLEWAIVLMGCTISFGAIAAVGLPLLLSIAATVVLAIAVSFMIGRLLGLPTKMAVLIACGNAICGNSAIAAVAPVIDADSDDVAASIAFTAVLGVVVVLALPVAAELLHLSPAAGGVLAGLTVYAVPQVIAAAGPLGATAVQLGTLVKLVRVLMLGPIVTGLSLVAGAYDAADETHPRPAHLLPPFILAFLALAALNSLHLLPAALAAPAHHASIVFTVMAMAALGLGVDVRSIRTAGPRVVLVVTASLGCLALTALAMMHLLKIS